MIFGSTINHYSEILSSPASENLKQIERFTALKMVNPEACSSPLQGRFLSFLSKIIQPALILEIGTFTAYGTLCLAEGLSGNGHLITIEANRDLEKVIDEHIKCYKGEGAIEVRFGNALEILPEIQGPVDLAFIDAAKKEYIQYYDALIHKMRHGGLIIADNVLWKGNVIDPQQDSVAKSMDAFNHHVLQDPRTENLILPFRDGLNLIRKL